MRKYSTLMDSSKSDDHSDCINSATLWWNNVEKIGSWAFKAFQILCFVDFYRWSNLNRTTQMTEPTTIPTIPFSQKIKIFVSHMRRSSVTRLGDLLDFGQLFKAFGNNQFAQISHIRRQFLYRCKNYHFSSEIIFGQLL